MPETGFIPQLVAFDLDDTLAPSKSALPETVATQLRRLLDRVPVCVISGGNLTQFEKQLLATLNATAHQLAQLHLMPTCGTQYLTITEGKLETIYAHTLSADQRDRAITALEKESRRLGFWVEDSWGPIIEDRGSQITYSALGQEAPLAAKKEWDPHGQKKELLRAAVANLLPDLDVHSGGSTSVDVTMRGVDKAYGMQCLVEATGIPSHQMLFIGDRLDEGGNDRPVLEAGFPCTAVTGPEQTAQVISQLCEQMDAG